MNTVDDFVRHKVLPEFHDIVAMLRELMRECAPHATERISYGLPMWIEKSTLAWIRPTKTPSAITYSNPWNAMQDEVRVGSRLGLAAGSA